MKKFLLLMFSSVLFTGVVAKAQASLSIEASALIQDVGFQKILNTRKSLASKNGRTLRINSFNILDLSPKKYIYATLSSKVSSDVGAKYISIGSIVGSIVYGPLGEVIFNGMYFKPEAAVPGGISVGNN
jgi:hypothetical protein